MELYKFSPHGKEYARLNQDGRLVSFNPEICRHTLQDNVSVTTKSMAQLCLSLIETCINLCIAQSRNLYSSPDSSELFCAEHLKGIFLDKIHDQENFSQDARLAVLRLTCDPSVVRFDDHGTIYFGPFEETIEQFASQLQDPQTVIGQMLKATALYPSVRT